MSREIDAWLHCSRGKKGIQITSGSSLITNSSVCYLVFDYCPIRQFYEGSPASTDCFLITPSCQCMNYVLDHASVVGSGVSVYDQGERIPKIVMNGSASAQITFTMAMVSSGTKVYPSYPSILRQWYKTSVLRNSMSQRQYVASEMPSLCHESTLGYPASPATFVLNVENIAEYRLFDPDTFTTNFAIVFSICIVIFLLSYGFIHYIYQLKQI